MYFSCSIQSYVVEWQTHVLPNPGRYLRTTNSKIQLSHRYMKMMRMKVVELSICNQIGWGSFPV